MRTTSSCSKSLAEQGKRFGFEGSEACTPDRWLKDGDTVTVGEAILGVRHCPGHTPGHVVFYNQDAKLAFVGDVLFRGSVGRSDLPRGNHAQLVELDHKPAMAARRRHAFRARPRPDLDLRLGAQDQSLRVGPRARPYLKRAQRTAYRSF